jgi:hypothetical protein
VDVADQGLDVVHFRGPKALAEFVFDPEQARQAVLLHEFAKCDGLGVDDAQVLQPFTQRVVTRRWSGHDIVAE